MAWAGWKRFYEIWLPLWASRSEKNWMLSFRSGRFGSSQLLEAPSRASRTTGSGLARSSSTFLSAAWHTRKSPGPGQSQVWPQTTLQGSTVEPMPAVTRVEVDLGQHKTSGSELFPGLECLNGVNMSQMSATIPYESGLLGTSPLLCSHRKAKHDSSSQRECFCADDAGSERFDHGAY